MSKYKNPASIRTNRKKLKIDDVLLVVADGKDAGDGGNGHHFDVGSIIVVTEVQSLFGHEETPYKCEGISNYFVTKGQIDHWYMNDYNIVKVGKL